MKIRCTVITILVFSWSFAFGQYTTVGTAISNGNCFELTQNSNMQIGGVWSNSTFDLTLPFTLTFNMDLGDIASNSDADGLAFVMQQDGLGVLGGIGGNLGYTGLHGVYPPISNNSLGVAFRTWTWDVLEIWNHSVADISGTPYTLPPVSGVRPATITWNPESTTLSVDFNNDGIDLTWNNDIINNFFGGNPVVYWGFTSANYVATPVQSVCDIQMIVTPPIPTMGQWSVFVFGLLILTMGVVFAYNMRLTAVRA
jgi:hypothetical protein